MWGRRAGDRVAREPSRRKRRIIIRPGSLCGTRDRAERRWRARRAGVGAEWEPASGYGHLREPTRRARGTGERRLDAQRQSDELVACQRRRASDDSSEPLGARPSWRFRARPRPRRQRTVSRRRQRTAEAATEEASQLKGRPGSRRRQRDSEPGLLWPRQTTAEAAGKQRLAPVATHGEKGARALVRVVSQRVWTAAVDSSGEPACGEQQDPAF